MRIELNKIYHGDCMELMKYIPDKSISVILSDIPYGIDYQSSWKIDKDKRFDKIKNDKKPFTGFIKEVPRIIKNTGAIMLFTRWDVQQVYIEELKKYGFKTRSVIIWDKKTHGMGDLKKSYGSSYESILFAPCDGFEFPNGRPSDIIRCSSITGDKLIHPNEKPVNLMRALIRQTCQVGGVILYITAGSGSTLVAAIREHVDFIGFEIENKYFDIAKKRIELEYMQPSLF